MRRSVEVLIAEVSIRTGRSAEKYRAKQLGICIHIGVTKHKYMHTNGYNEIKINPLEFDIHENGASTSGGCSISVKEPTS
jgi:hypothetical protein